MEGGCEKEKWTRVMQQAGTREVYVGEMMRLGEGDRKRKRKVREDKWMEGEMDIQTRGVVG